jgi:bzd-type benzoyl-CoA reductase N subunit
VSIDKSELKGLQAVKEIVENREMKARELRGKGKKVIGYLCALAPAEILTAGDLLPFRIMGNLTEPLSTVDSYMESNMCPYVRNCFDLALKGRYDFLDGLLMSHTCDTVIRLYGIWKYYLNPPYTHFMNVPHTIKETTKNFYKRELKLFKKSIEKLIGHNMSEDQIKQAIHLHNENKALVKELYDLRKQDPPLLSGTEIMEIAVAGMSIPAQEFNNLLKEVKKEVESRKERPIKRKARVLVYGCIMDNPTFIKLVEECGANVVMDDTCIGTRSYWNEVPLDDDIWDGLVESYFVKFQCPRTFREADTARFQYILNYAREFKVNSVIFYTLRFCDPHLFDVPDLRDFLQEGGLPVLVLEDDATMATIQGFRTRIQAFIEMIH